MVFRWDSHRGAGTAVGTDGRMNGRTFHQRWPFLLPLPSPLSLSAPPPPTMPPEPTRPRCSCQPWQKNNEESKKSKQHSSGWLLLAASWETWESTKEERNQERRTATRGQDRVVVVYCNLPPHQCLVVHSLRINGFLGTRRGRQRRNTSKPPFLAHLCVARLRSWPLRSEQTLRSKQSP